MKRLAGIFVFALPLLSAAHTLALDVPSAPPTRVNDYAGLLSNYERATLEQILAEGEQAAHVQVVVVIIRSLRGENLADYSSRLFNTWGIGREGANDGIGILVVHDDRKVRLAVGRGLETIISNDAAADIVSRVIVPRFREAKYFDGLEQATRAVFTRIRAARTAPPSPSSQQRPSTAPTDADTEAAIKQLRELMKRVETLTQPTEMDKIVAKAGFTPVPHDPAPNFVLESVEGRRIALAEFRGRPVVVYFWASW